MKFVILSDIHLTEKTFVCRKDNIFETQMRKLGFVIDWVKENRAVLITAADIFDKCRGYKILVQLLCKLLKIDITIMGIFGQHDMFFRKIAPETNLGILNMLNMIIALDDKKLCFNLQTGVIGDYSGKNTVGIYGCSYGQEIPLPDSDNEIKILVIHAPIYDVPVPQIIGTQAKQFLKNHSEYDLIITGDIHQKFIYEENGRMIVNTGCMLRKTVDIAEHKPCFFVYDTNTRSIEEIEIPHAPMEEVISDKHLKQKEYILKSLSIFTDQIKSNGNVSGVKIKDNLLNFLKDNNIEEGVSSIFDTVLSGGNL